MIMSHQQKSIYEFGPYRLDAAERILSRDGAIVPLQPKVFDLLLVLVERRGRLLEKDELMKAIWPNTVVEEVNLANNVSILRKTIGENGRQYIETAPKLGYRFVAEVRELNKEGAERVIPELQAAGRGAVRIERSPSNPRDQTP
jgi:DNA-binding winged helix-turn-helix (wHTH) protein